MTTNVLLIVIIVLLVLGLILQFMQLVLAVGLPDRFLDLFFDSADNVLHPEEMTAVDVIDVDTQEDSTNFKGFGKSKKSKRSKRRWPRRTQNSPTEEVAEAEVETEEIDAKDK